MGWEQIIYYIIVAIIAIAVAPKPPKPRPATLEDFDIPTAEEGRPVPVVFGTVKVTGPNVLWYGDLSTNKIKKGGLFGSTTIGYKYNLGLHFGVCHGPIDYLYRLETGEKVVFYTPAGYSTNQSIYINQPGLYGGKKREGGIVGYLDVMMGDAAQTENGYLNLKLGVGPAYRGIFGLVWKGASGTSGGYIGNSPYLKPWAFTVQRVLQGWQGGTAWYSAKARIGSGITASMNGAHIIYEALTNSEWGMGLPTAALNEATFLDAADTLYTESFGLSVMWNREGAIEEFLQTILDHIAGVLAFNRATGKFELILLRGDYVPSSLPLYGPSEILEVSSYQRQAWGETINELTVNYTDNSTKKSTAITVHDLANIATQGVRIAQNANYPGIVDSGIAQQVAMRELVAKSTPIARVTFTVNRNAWPSKIGDVVRITWPQLGISELVVRIVAARAGKLEDGGITLDTVEDIFSLPTNVYTSQPTPGADPVPPVYEEDDDFAGATVFSAGWSSPPGSPADGSAYLVPFGASGDWAGHDNQVATYDLDTGTWTYETVTPGTVIYIEDTQTSVQGDTTNGFTEYVPVLGDGAIAFTSVITPPALAADANDYAPTGLDVAAVLRLSATTTTRTITGITLGTDGRLLFVHNVGSFAIVLADENVGSAAPNRFALTANVTLQPDQSSLLQYDSTTQRWRIIGGTGSGGSPTTTKGDLIVRGSSADERLAVGPDYYVLEAYSPAGPGVRWAQRDPIANYWSNVRTPNLGLYWFTDFIDDPTSANDVWTNTGGQMAPGDAANPGIFRLDAAGASGLAGFYQKAKPYRINSDVLVIEALVRLSLIFDSTDTGNCWVGLSSAASPTTNDPLIGAGILYNGGTSRSDWAIYCQDGVGTDSNTTYGDNTGIVADTWQLWRVEVSAADIKLYVDNTLRVTHLLVSGNIPPGTEDLGVHARCRKNGGTLTANFDIDFIQVTKSFASPRTTNLTLSGNTVFVQPGTPANPTTGDLWFW